MDGPSEKGSVLVDIGGDVGAAIVRTPASLAGCEVEIRRFGAVWDGTHVAVRARHLSEEVVHAGLFSGLGQGLYEVRLKGDDTSPVVQLTVEGGRVSQTCFAPEPLGSGTGAKTGDVLSGR